MNNKMYFKKIKGIGWVKESVFNYLLLENGDKIKLKDLKKPDFGIECQNCDTIININFYSTLNKKSYICNSCNKIGEKNPFYGKKHTDDTIKKQSEVKNGKYNGEKNPFYGKTHSEDTKKQISKNRKGKATGVNAPFYGRSHTEDTKKEIIKKQKLWRESLSKIEKNELSKKISDSQKKLREENEEEYLKLKRKAGRISQMSVKRYAKNGLETRVHEKLIEMGIEMDYCVILGYHQFDFGNKNARILLEVQGDYWHGNPEVYEESKLNHIQIKNKENDKIKKEFANNNTLKLFYLWEKDFNEGNYKILEDIKNEIQISKTKNKKVTF